MASTLRPEDGKPFEAITARPVSVRKDGPYGRLALRDYVSFPSIGSRSGRCQPPERTR